MCRQVGALGRCWGASSASIVAQAQRASAARVEIGGHEDGLAADRRVPERPGAEGREESVAAGRSGVARAKP